MQNCTRSAFPVFQFKIRAALFTDCTPTLILICSETVVCLYVSLFPDRQLFLGPCILSFVCLFVCSLTLRRSFVRPELKFTCTQPAEFQPKWSEVCFPTIFQCSANSLFRVVFRGSWDPLKREERAAYCAGTTKPDYYATTAPGQGLTKGWNKLGPKLKMEQDQFWDQNQDGCIDSLASTTITKTSAQSSCFFSWLKHSSQDQKQRISKTKAKAKIRRKKSQSWLRLRLKTTTKANTKVYWPAWSLLHSRKKQVGGSFLVDCPTQLICTWISICCVPWQS